MLKEWYKSGKKKIQKTQKNTEKHILTQEYDQEYENDPSEIEKKIQTKYTGKGKTMRQRYNFSKCFSVAPTRTKFISSIDGFLSPV